MDDLAVVVLASIAGGCMAVVALVWLYGFGLSKGWWH